MDHASFTIALWFTVSVTMFAALAAFLVYDQRRVQSPARTQEPVPHDSAPSRRAISRTQLAIVAVTFCVWSLMIADHLRPRR